MHPRLFLLKPKPILRARVNMTSPAYPLDRLDFDNVTYDGLGNMSPGMTLTIGSTEDGSDYGRQRIREPYEPSTNRLEIGLTSQGIHDGELNVVDNAYITVWDDFRVWAKIPWFDRAQLAWFKDADVPPIPYISHPVPKANAGVGYAGTLRPGLSVASVKLSAHGSFVFDSSEGISSPSYVQWMVADGVIVSGDENELDIEATFPPGFRWVRLNVYSPTGIPGDPTRTHSMRIPVYVRDPDDLDGNSFDGFQITGHTETKYGAAFDLHVLEDIPRTTFPDGTLAMLWDDEAIPSAELHRNHMMFIGWLESEQGNISPQQTGTLRNTTLHLVDVAGRLKTLPAFSQIQEYTTTPTAWHHTIFPNIFYYIHYLLYWHSTAFELANLEWVESGYFLADLEFKILGSEAGNLFDQVNRLANAVTPDHHLTCDRWGRLHLVPDILIEYYGDRPPTSSAMFALSDTYRTTFRYEYNHSPRVFQLVTYAITGGRDTIASINCMSPGLGQGQGINYLETSERIAKTQGALNICEGNRYARMNAPIGQVVVECPASVVDGVDVSPAFMRWFLLTVGNAREINRIHRITPFDQENIRCLLHEMSVRYEYGATGLARTYSFTLEVETAGIPAMQPDLIVWGAGT